MKNLNQYIREGFVNANGGDEFYTRLKDIERELSHYDFTNKIVYCNCDNPKFSNFYKYFHDNFDKLRLKHLIVTYFANDAKRYDFDGKTIKTTKIKSGRFQDNVDIMRECDIVVTNPPFSDKMPREFVKLCNDNKIDFIIVSPLSLAYKEPMFTMLKNNNARCGYTSINTFERPSSNKNDNKNAACAWFTTLHVEKKTLKTNKHYDDNYTLDDSGKYLNVKSYKDIPDDYNEPIATSVRFLTHINTKQFDILGHGTIKIDGKKSMERVFIKRK